MSPAEGRNERGCGCVARTALDRGPMVAKRKGARTAQRAVPTWLGNADFHRLGRSGIKADDRVQHLAGLEARTLGFGGGIFDGHRHGGAGFKDDGVVIQKASVRGEQPGKRKYFGIKLITELESGLWAAPEHLAFGQ